MLRENRRLKQLQGDFVAPANVSLDASKSAIWRDSFRYAGQKTYGSSIAEDFSAVGRGAVKFLDSLWISAEATRPDHGVLEEIERFRSDGEVQCGIDPCRSNWLGPAGFCHLLAVLGPASSFAKDGIRILE